MEFLNKKALVILIGVIILIGFIGWFVYKYEQERSQSDISSRLDQELQRQNQDLPKKEEQITTSVINTKTYRNEEWDFEFEYLESWDTRIPEFGSSVSLFNIGVKPSDSGGISPIVINVTPKEWIEGALVKMRARGVFTKDIILAGRPALQIEDHDRFSRPATITLVLVNDEFWIDITGIHTYQTEYNQLLSTFKFLK